MKNKSLFSQILKYFLVTLILPFCTIFLLYGYAESTVKDQMVLSGERTLTQFFALVDKTMEDVSQTCISVGNEDSCSEYIKNYLSDPNESKYDAVEVYNTLRGYIDDAVYDILVYYPAADRVISVKNGSLPTENYLAATYGEKNAECFAPLLQCNSRKPRISSFQNSDQQTYLCVNMLHTTRGSSERDYIVSVVLSPKFLSSMMMQERLGTNGTLVVFDSQRNLLLSGDGNTFYNLMDYDTPGALLEVKTENGKYMMLAEPAQSIAGYYAYAIGMRAFWSELSNLRMVCLIACALCLVLTVVLVVRGTKHVYDPIGTVVQRVEQRGVGSYDRKEHNEIEFIEKILDKSSTERTDLRRQVRKGNDLQRDQFIHALLKGKINLKDSDEEVLKKNGIPMFTNQYRVVLIFVQKRKDIDASTQDFVIRNVFEEVSRTNGYGYVTELEENQYALLINLGQNADPQEEMGNLRGCQSYVRRQLGLELILASGKIHDGISEICKSYEEAELAMKYKYLMDDADYIDYQAVKNREFSYVSSMESNLSRSIVGYINGKFSELSAEQFVGNMMEKCGINSTTSMDNIECFKYEIISIINKVFMICAVTEGRKERIQDLVMQPTLSKFQTELAQLLEMLRNTKLHRSRNETICQKVIEYIMENYADPQLSVTQLGDELKLSPYYVSKLFKENQEITVSDFISKTRIAKAKEQLRNTEMSIKSIAEENGFLSSNVFIRTFKKWEGITPGVYREQNSN